MNVSNYDEAVYNLTKKGLDASAIRSKVISNNVANVNTKNYKRYYVSFEDTLSDNMNKLQMKKSDPLHLGGTDGEGSITVKQDKDSVMRQDGNNVDVENEMTNLAANTLMYNALITQANSKLSMERYVITNTK
ncbi:flagellar basal body rod protein FlgB [Clostridium oryzae]|uniref:Flagellar basal body rod protein FlgB n=1 Tax=Clostridium oryzae TaxID=1450648 RepID=A0A1V4ITE0_9CLOT|nr:flagellar basal body rod protein FlgB [Clostridium oryzae]OPJ63282.1 flagellar basal body rod protein FlgB [Clostridium oryzae]